MQAMRLPPIRSLRCITCPTVCAADALLHVAPHARRCQSVWGSFMVARRIGGSASWQRYWPTMQESLSDGQGLAGSLGEGMHAAARNLQSAHKALVDIKAIVHVQPCPHWSAFTSSISLCGLFRKQWPVFLAVMLCVLILQLLPRRHFSREGEGPGAQVTEV